jgi:long-chain fatty acid transport protein
MFMKKSCKCLVTMVLLFAAMPRAEADGYRNPPPTAEGLAKGSANAAFVDDASATFYNPANLGMQTEKSLVVAGTFARSETTYSPLPGVELKSDDPMQVLPNIFYSQPVGLDGLVVGLGLSTPYGQNVAWDAEELVNPSIGVVEAVPYEAEVLLININPTASAKLRDNLYLGIGADIFYSDFTLKALFPSGDPTVPLDVEGSGDGWGIGANVGLTWLPAEGHRVALTYRSRVDITYKGDFKADYPNAGDFQTTLKYPNTFGVGYGVQVRDNVQFEALVEWLEWSVNDTQTIDAGGSEITLDNNWDDTFTLNCGVDWAATDALAVRAGYTYLPSPIPDGSASPLLPDLDRHVLGIGLGCSMGMHTVDVAYSYSIYDDRETTTGTYEVDSNLVSMTYSLSF